jgi:hypothetical protein
MSFIERRRGVPISGHGGMGELVRDFLFQNPLCGNTKLSKSGGVVWKDCASVMSLPDVAIHVYR